MAPVNLKNIEGGTTGLGGVWPQIIGINPAGTTNVLGQTTISTKIFGGVSRNPNGSPGPLDLAQTVAHESLHQTQESWFQRMGKENPAIEDEADAFIQKNRQKILDCLKNQCSR